MSYTHSRECAKTVIAAVFEITKKKWKQPKNAGVHDMTFASIARFNFTLFVFIPPDSRKCNRSLS